MLLGLFLLGFAPMGAGAEATVPTWQVGKEWSLGMKLNIGELTGPLIEELKGKIPLEAGVSKFELSIPGELGFYEIYKVVGVEGGQYKVSITAGLNLDVRANLEIRAQMPKPGTYGWAEEPPKEERTVSGDGKLEVAVWVDGFMYWTQDKLALTRVDMTLKGEMAATANVKGVPMPGYGYGPGSITIVYQDISLSADGTASFDLHMLFDPPLDIFNFPISVDENWVASSNATTWGSFSYDVGISGFLGVIRKRDSREFPRSTTPMSLPLACTGTEEVTLEDGSRVAAYRIEVRMPSPWEYITEPAVVVRREEKLGLAELAQSVVQPQTGGTAYAFYYSPAEGFIVKRAISVPTRSILAPLQQYPAFRWAIDAERLTGSADITSNPVSEQEARDFIAKTGITKGWGLFELLAISAAVAVGVAAVVVVVRRRLKRETSASATEF